MNAISKYIDMVESCNLVTITPNTMVRMNITVVGATGSALVAEPIDIPFSELKRIAKPQPEFVLSDEDAENLFNLSQSHEILFGLEGKQTTLIIDMRYSVKFHTTKQTKLSPSYLGGKYISYENRNLGVDLKNSLMPKVDSIIINTNGAEYMNVPNKIQKNCCLFIRIPSDGPAKCIYLKLLGITPEEYSDIVKIRPQAIGDCITKNKNGVIIDIVPYCRSKFGHIKTGYYFHNIGRKIFISQEENPNTCPLNEESMEEFSLFISKAMYVTTNSSDIHSCLSKIQEYLAPAGITLGVKII